MNLRPFLLVPALLAGCVAPTPVGPAKSDTAVTVTSHLEVRDSANRQVLGALPEPMTPWRKVDIDHVQLSLYYQGGNTPISSLTIKQGELSKSVKFVDLAMNSSYRVEARAWADASGAVPIDDAVASAASCVTSFQTTRAPLVDVGAIKLQLRDKTFVGKATSTGVAVTDGQIHDTTATPGIELLDN